MDRYHVCMGFMIRKRRKNAQIIRTGLTFGAIRFLVCIGRYTQVANFQGHRASKQIDLGKENSLATSCSTSLMKSGLLDCSINQTKNLPYLAKNPDFHLSWQHIFLARFVKLHINDIRTNLRYNLCNQLVPELFDTADFTCSHSAGGVEVKYILPH